MHKITVIRTEKKAISKGGFQKGLKLGNFYVVFRNAVHNTSKSFLKVLCRAWNCPLCEINLNSLLDVLQSWKFGFYKTSLITWSFQNVWLRNLEQTNPTPNSFFSDASPWITVTLAMIGKFQIAASFAVIYVYAGELVNQIFVWKVIH